MSLKVCLPRDDRKSQFVLEEIGRWAGLKLEFVRHDSRTVLLHDSSRSLSLWPVVDLTREQASKLLTDSVTSLHDFDTCHHALSLIFHVLAGADEVDPRQRDSRQRYDDSDGLLGRLGLTDTLIVDALAENLLTKIRKTWPQIGGLDRTTSLHVSHDVDAPYLYAFSGFRGLVKAMLADARQVNPGLANLRSWFASIAGDDEADPYFLFDWLMSQSEKRGLASTFYFIAGRSGGRLDGDYDLGSPRMSKLLRRVIERGHNIGLHASYNAFRSLETLQAEKDRLAALADAASWRPTGMPVRMHYLRFDPVVTPGVLEQAGFAFDASLGFARRAGFRRGTMREFRLWDWSRSRATGLVEKPLMVMDASLYKPENENLTPQLAEHRVRSLVDTVQSAGGGINLLWHNNFFFTARHRSAYEEILGHAASSSPRQATT